MGSGKNPDPINGESEEFLHPLSAADQSQTLTLTADAERNFTGESSPSNGESSNSISNSNYRSAMTTLSSSTDQPAASDPFLFPPSLDSPSYADVMFNPNGNGEISGDDAVSPPQSDLSTSDFLRIGVSDPQKESEPSNSIVPGGNTFVSYLITTSTSIPDYEGSEFGVRRRFKDVVTLSDRLSEAYRGFFVPPRPDKSLVESQVMQKQEFVEQRRAEIEKYLKRLARHPTIRRSDELRAFLTVRGRMPLPASIDAASRMLDGAVRLPKQLLGESRSSVMEPQDVVHSAKGGRDMLRFFKELKQSVVNDWGNARPAVEEEDTEFLERKGKLKELEQHLTNASQQVSFAFFDIDRT